MKDTLTEIQNDLIECGDDYHLMAQHRATLSAIYARYSERLKNVLKTKATVWREMRKEEKNATETDRRWDSSEMGIEEMELKLDLKSMDKMLSSLNQLIKVQQNDYYNTK